MNRKKSIIISIKRLIEQGFLFVLVGIIISYLLYDMIGECVILKRVVLAESVLGIILLSILMVNRIFDDVFSRFSKKSLIISVIWFVVIGVCLVGGVLINISGFSEPIQYYEKVSDNGEQYNFKTSRKQIKLEEIDNDWNELTTPDISVGWHCITEDTYDPNGRIYHLINYEYDDTGKIKRKIFYSTDGEIEKYEDYIYNNKGNLIKVEVYKKADNDSDSKHVYVYDTTDLDNIAYEYNDKNQCIYERLLQNSRLGDYIAYEYDNDGNLNKKESISNNQIDLAYEYHYDEKGNIINIISVNMSDGRVYNKAKTTFSYEYDRDGNLKKQTEDNYLIYWYSGDWFAGTGQYVERDEPDDTTSHDIWIKYYDENGNIEKEERWEGIYSDEEDKEEIKNELSYYTMYSYEYF